MSEEKKQKGISEHTSSGPCGHGQFSSKYSVEKTPQGRSDVSISLKNYRIKGRENIVGEKSCIFVRPHSFQSHSLLPSPHILGELGKVKSITSTGAIRKIIFYFN